MYNFVYYLVEETALKGDEHSKDLEILADLLLRLAGRDEHYPAYPESRNAQRELIDAQRASQLAPLHHNPQVDAVHFLRQREIALMLENTPLTSRQRGRAPLLVRVYLRGDRERMGHQQAGGAQALPACLLRHPPQLGRTPHERLNAHLQRVHPAPLCPSGALAEPR